jgi:hypothetical protein
LAFNKPDNILPLNYVKPQVKKLSFIYVDQKIREKSQIQLKTSQYFVRVVLRADRNIQTERVGTEFHIFECLQLREQWERTKWRENRICINIFDEKSGNVVRPNSRWHSQKYVLATF